MLTDSLCQESGKDIVRAICFVLWHLGLQQEGPEGLGDSTSGAKNHLKAFFIHILMAGAGYHLEDLQVAWNSSQHDFLSRGSWLQTPMSQEN